MAKPLNERIASALSTDRVTLTDLARLVEDASTARDSAAARVEQATADSINFALSEADRDDAAAIADKARREAAALTAALEQLEAKLVAKREGEGVKAREAERAALLAERDELAERLRAEWPEIEARVLGLLSAIKANDERMKAAGVHEASAEAVARGVEGTFRVGPSAVRRLTEMKIPSFAGAPTELAWPPSNAAALAAAMRGPDYAEERAKRERAEAAEMARWKPYRLTPGLSHKSGFAIDILAKASVAERFASEVTIYNYRQLPTDDAAPSIRVITDETAERLRDLGYEVEQIEQAEQVAA